MKTNNLIHLGSRKNISPANILMLKSDINYTIIYLDDGSKFMSSTTLGQIEKRLKGFQFFRPNRSIIFNLEFMADYEAKAQSGCYGKILLKNNEKIARMLISAGAFVNAIDDNGDTSLHYATSRGVLNIVAALIDAGATVGIANGQGVTPIHKAAIFGQLAVIRRLLETKIDINCVDLQGDTALHYAAKCGFPSIIKLLLDNGASQAIRNGAGLSPKDVAVTNAIAQLFGPVA